MIQGFEQQTQPLNDYERGTLLPLIIRGLVTKVGASNVIAGSTIIRKMRECGYKLDGPRLRKIINHIRTSDIIPGLVSTSQGYFVATTATEIDECIVSLQGRVDATQAIIRALQRQKSMKF
jgi:hypothetical protein